jgi:hypothetical protein
MVFLDRVVVGTIERNAWWLKLVVAIQQTIRIFYRVLSLVLLLGNVWGRGAGGGLGEVMMKRRSKRGSGVLISSDRVYERLCLGLQNTRRCSGVAKRCLQSIGRNATLILGSVDVFWLPHMACLDPRSLLHNQGLLPLNGQSQATMDRRGGSEANDCS